MLTLFHMLRFIAAACHWDTKENIVIKLTIQHEKTNCISQYAYSIGLVGWCRTFTLIAKDHRIMVYAFRSFVETWWDMPQNNLCPGGVCRAPAHNV